MSDQSDRIFDEESMVALMAQEQEKEITKVSTLQGQSIGLLALLLNKGLLEPSDVSNWESLSEMAAGALTKILINGSDLDNPEQCFSNEAEVLKAKIEFLDGNITFGHLLRHDLERMTSLGAERQACVERLKELGHAPETD